VLHRVQAFILGARATHDRLQPDLLRGRVGALDPVRGTAAHVVPWHGAARIALLACAEFFQVVRRGHAADVEEVFVLADALRTRCVVLALRRNAVDRHFRLVDGDRAQQTDLRAELVHQVDVRIQAQIARTADHPVRRRLAELARIVGMAREIRPVFRIGPLRPQQHVPLFECIEAAALAAPVARVHGADLVLALCQLFLAAVGGGRIVPMHGRDVVAVRAIFRLQLPVAFKGIGGGATQHFQPVRRLIDDHVDDLAGFAEEFLEWRHVVVQAAEQKTLVVGEARDFFQVVRAFLVEAFRIARVLRILHLQQLAAVVEGPAVERAGIGGLVAPLVAAQLRAAMAAGVDEGIQFAQAVARDEDGLAANVRGVVVIVVGDLAFMRQVDPVAFEDVLHLEFEQGFIGEGAAVQAMVARGLVLDQQGIEIGCLAGGWPVWVDGDHGVTSRRLRGCVRFARSVRLRFPDTGGSRSRSRQTAVAGPLRRWLRHR